jgi:alcohol dehydrogenase
MNPQRIYQHYNPGRLIFGPKSLNELAKEIPASEIPLVITDQGVSKSGILKRATDVLDGAGIRYHIFD